jgi:hypothetical protein
MLNALFRLEENKPRNGGYMKKIMVTLIAASLLSATTAVPVFAGGWGGHSRGGGVDLFWPITAALAIPAAIVGTVAHIAVPEPVYVSPPVPIEPQVYSGPATYYSPRPYYEPRVYVAPRGYYAPRDYYPDRGHYRSYRGGW